MTTTAADALSQAITAADAERALDELAGLRESELLRTLEAAVDQGLRGSRPAVRAYVQAYRGLADDVLRAAHASYPDLVVETDDGLALIDVTGVPSGAARVILEEGAARAPFSAWVTVFGTPEGLVLDLVSRVREALQAVDPLQLPPGVSAFPHWEDVDATAVLAFIRNVRRELATDGAALDTIADSFDLNDTELGQIFGVKRQAIGQWRADGVPARRAAKVATVASITDLLTRKLKADRLPGIARRPADAYGGLSMLDLIAADRHRELHESVRESFAYSTTA